jgi:hypothetical protein
MPHNAPPVNHLDPLLPHHVPHMGPTNPLDHLRLGLGAHDRSVSRHTGDRCGDVTIGATIPDVEHVEIVLANNDRMTLRVGDVSLKIDAESNPPRRRGRDNAMAPAPTPEAPWRPPSEHHFIDRGEITGIIA